MEWVILLLIAALSFTIAEVSFPSFGMLGLMSAACYVGAILLAFKESQSAGYTILVIVLILVPVSIVGTFKALPHTPMGRRLILKAPTREDIAQAPDRELASLVGARGSSVSM